MISYFAQVQLIWLVFYGLYYFLLSRDTFFQANRIYLLVSLMIGLVFPLNPVGLSSDDIAIVWMQPFVIDAGGVIDHSARVGGAAAPSAWAILGGLYLTGVFAASIRLIRGFARISQILQRSRPVEFDGITVMDTQGQGLPPFSFGYWIFADLSRFDDSERYQVIRHELTHLRQWHTLDNIWLELLKVFFWWSPLIYAYQRSLGNQHEYLADQGVVKNRVPTARYGRFLLRQVHAGNQLHLANHLIFSRIGKRIIMMTRHRSQRRSLFKYTIALPLLVFFTCLFAEKSVHILEQADTNAIIPWLPPSGESPAAQQLDSKPMQSIDPGPSNDTEFFAPPAAAISPSQDTFPLLSTADIDEMPYFQPGMDSLYRYLGSNLIYPEIARLSNIEGMVLVSFIIDVDGSISQVKVAKGFSNPSDTRVVTDPNTNEVTTLVKKSEAAESLEAEAVRVVSHMPPGWAPGKRNGRAVKVMFHLPLRFRLN